MIPRTQEAFQNILDCFSAADGGKSLLSTKALIEEMERQVEEHGVGSHQAGQVIDVVLHFSMLIDIATGKVKP